MTHRSRLKRKRDVGRPAAGVGADDDKELEQAKSDGDSLRRKDGTGRAAGVDRRGLRRVRG